MNDDFSRRGFLKSATMAMAPGVLPALGANGKLRIGWIGTGARGYHCMNQLYLASAPLVEITAVCDTYQTWLNRAKERVQALGKNTPRPTWTTGNCWRIPTWTQWSSRPPSTCTSR